MAQQLTYEELPFVDEVFDKCELPDTYSGASPQQRIDAFDHYHDLAARVHFAPVSFKGQWDGQAVWYWTGAYSVRPPGIPITCVQLTPPPQEPRALAKHRLHFAKLAYQRAAREFQDSKALALHLSFRGDLEQAEADLTAKAEVARWWSMAITAIEQFLHPPTSAVSEYIPPRNEQRERLLDIDI